MKCFFCLRVMLLIYLFLLYGVFSLEDHFHLFPKSLDPDLEILWKFQGWSCSTEVGQRWCHLDRFGASTQCLGKRSFSFTSFEFTDSGNPAKTLQKVLTYFFVRWKVIICTYMYIYMFFCFGGMGSLIFVSVYSGMVEMIDLVSWQPQLSYGRSWSCLRGCNQIAGGKRVIAVTCCDPVSGNSKLSIAYKLIEYRKYWFSMPSVTIKVYVALGSWIWFTIIY